MIALRKSNERGQANHGWLDTRHTFSFANYYDPRFMGFRTLRVINEDKVAPAQGFGTHAHSDMEILSYVISGGLAHRDSMGNGETIHPGEWQRMSAGSGVRHSEFNASETEPVHFLQIWILPESEGIEPSYEQKLFLSDDKIGKLKLVASHDARDGSLKIHQDVSLYNGILRAGDKLEQKLEAGRSAWVQVIKGEIELDNVKLQAGDGAAITDEESLKFEANEESEILLFDLA
jgi:redox-sensitive bicupin YhaK (pirin superfamily)